MKDLLQLALQPSTNVPARRQVLSDIVDRPQRRPADLPGEGRTGAVMILVYSNQGETYFVLTKRHGHLKHHGGQISLPGGSQDAGESLLETAVRETEEEIGVERKHVKILGALESVYIPPSDFTIFPFVAWHDGPIQFLRSEYEVAEIIETPLQPLLSTDSLVKGSVKTNNSTVCADYFDVFGHQVWGATALVLCDFIDRIRAQTGR